MSKAWALVLIAFATGGCSQSVKVTAKQLYSDPVSMNGKAVRLRAVIVGNGAEGKIGDKPCGWISDSYNKDRGYMDGPSTANAVAIMPVPHMGNGTVVEIEGVYDGETDCLHMTSCNSVPP